MSLSEKISYKKGIAKALILIGNIYYEQGKYEKCLEYNLRTLKIREELKDEYGVASALANMGLISQVLNRQDEALDYYLKSLDAFREMNIKNPKKEYESSIAGSLLNVGFVYSEQKKFDDAMKYFQQAYSMFERLGSKTNMAACLNNIGSVYKNQNKMNESLEYHIRALNLYDEIGDTQGQSSASANLASIYLDLDEYNKAIFYCEKSLKLAKEMSILDDMEYSYKILSQAYEKKGDYKRAYDYHKLYSDVKDSLLNATSSKQITEMQTKYETEKKEQQITLLNKDREIQNAEVRRQKIVIWSVVSGLLIVVLLAGFIFKERRKSEKLLLNILPVETAKELKVKGKATAKHYESVTVMFTDFKGFTTIAEKLSAEELVSELDFLFRKFDEIISKYNIEKIKTIGDAYMCASGLPTPNTNHAENIVKAALEIQSWMVEQNNKWQLRIGIHTGPVTAGVVGDKKFAYDIWGDTVNTASRMESSGEAGKINISGTTYHLIQKKFSCEFRGKIPAKNKGEIEMYFVEGG